MNANKQRKVAVILSVTSDIGTALAEHYSKKGYYTVGTYRSKEHCAQLKGIKNLKLIYCDSANVKSINGFIAVYKKLNLKWDVFISLPCTPLPLESFFGCDFNEWSDSVHLNAIEQLRVLHDLYTYRNNKIIADVVLFAGGGTNNAVINFSAYTISKIMLIKMCEFIDAETRDINIFIVGPGWTKTKTHYITLDNVDKSSKKYKETAEFMKSGTGTSMENICSCIEWLRKAGKKAASGRNFSVVHDKWEGPLSSKLKKELLKDENMYKLRRHKNNFLANK